jgi:hypothetical protein
MMKSWTALMLIVIGIEHGDRMDELTPKKINMVEVMPTILSLLSKH